jgi:hypothetical protein
MGVLPCMRANLKVETTDNPLVLLIRSECGNVAAVTLAGEMTVLDLTKRITAAVESVDLAAAA